MREYSAEKHAAERAELLRRIETIKLHEHQIREAVMNRLHDKLFNEGKIAPRRNWIVS